MKRLLFFLLLLSLLFIARAFCCAEETVPAETAMPAIFTLEDSYYDCLETDEERLLYQKIGEAVCAYMENGTCAFVDAGISLTPYYDSLSHLGHAWLYDHPEAGPFWWKVRFTVRGDSEFSILPVTEPHPIVPDVWYEKQLHAMDLSGSDEERAKTLFFYLAESFSYDTEFQFVNSNDDSGFMENGTGCCQAFSFAYTRLCNMAGIPCVVSTCYNAAGYHMINFVKCGEDWLAVDTTQASGCKNRERAESWFGMDDRICSSTKPVYYPTTKHPWFDTQVSNLCELKEMADAIN